jgi:nicotinamidase-related amidase
MDGAGAASRDVLVVVDAISDFGHEQGERLLASFRERLPGLRGALTEARRAGTPVVYVNDHFGRWADDASIVLQRAMHGPGRDVIVEIAPQPGEPILLKARYSAFDHTGLELLLGELRGERLLLAGGATEACIVQTGIDARELGYQVTILAEACATLDAELEQLSLRYANEVGGMRIAPHRG